MSYYAAEEPTCTGKEGAVELVIEPREKDLGGFSVRRVLPARERRMVGPFIFFDHMGPAEFPPGQGIQVRPHPHIGLATITYLFEGEIIHRDNLGFVQPISAGAVNLMTAGRGIAHSERAGPDLDMTSRLHGIQSWTALPDDAEECEPAFIHYPADDIPEVDVGGVDVRVIMGEAYRQRSPVTCHSPTLYLECRMRAGGELELPLARQEAAAYVVSGAVEIGGVGYAHGTMAVAGGGGALRLLAKEESRVMIIGGEPLGERHIWWNFVSSSKDRIERAKADWRNGRFERIPGETELMPLPD